MPSQRAIVELWASAVRRNTVLNQRQARVAAQGWMTWCGVRPGFRSETELIRTTQAFLDAGFTPSDTAEWILGGFDPGGAEYYLEFGATAHEADQLNMAGNDEDSPLWMPDGFHPHLQEGVPPQLLCLILSVGCASVADLESFVDRWRSGEDISVGLRMLAGLTHG